MKSDTSLDEEELLSMAVDYLKMTAANEKTSKRPREEKEDRRATRKKRRAQSIKKRSKTEETVPSSTGLGHNYLQRRDGSDMCCESALEGYVTGYIDCTQEAVRYLLEEEGLYSTDQIIGLRNHLRDNEVARNMNSHSNSRSAESLRGQTLVCYNSRNSAGVTPPSPAAHQLPPIHELMSTSVNALAVPLSSLSSTSSTDYVPHGSMAALIIATTPFSLATTIESRSALSRGKRMEPLTVDTNQEYELPSHLQRQAEAAKESKEPLLTIAHTQPKVSGPVYTQSTVAPATLSAQSVHLAMSCATKRLGMETATASNSVVGGNTYGSNFNFAAPYVYEWVKPAH